MSATTAPRLCEVCSRPLPPHAGKGRPRTVCRDEDSPTPGTCRKVRNNRRDERRRDHRYAASLTLPGAFPGEADVLPPGESRAERLALAGFHDTTPTGRAYTVRRREHLDALHAQDKLDRYERRLAWEEWSVGYERRKVCREVCPLFGMRSPERIAAAAARRMARH